jgi:hypothetical protein
MLGISAQSTDASRKWYATPRRRTTVTLAMTTIGLLVAILGFANPAQAYSTSPALWLDVQTGRCLDSNYSGSAYTTSPCSSGNHYQDWILWYSADYSNFEMTSFQTVRCLDSNSSGAVYTLPCNGGNYQKWYLAGGILAGEFLMINVATGRCLDSNYSGNVYTSVNCSTSNGYQLWN